ncbi:MAG: hypothetical protein ACE5KM_16135 [Planctomycetaceae bacterium]
MKQDVRLRMCIRSYQESTQAELNMAIRSETAGRVRESGPASDYHGGIPSPVWQKRVDDKQPLSSKHPVSAKIDLTGHKRKPDRHQPPGIVRKYFELKGWDE